MQEPEQTTQTIPFNPQNHVHKRVIAQENINQLQTYKLTHILTIASIFLILLTSLMNIYIATGITMLSFIHHTWLLHTTRKNILYLQQKYNLQPPQKGAKS